MIKISVGWAVPSDELLLNVHITYDLLDWTNVVDYSMLADLKKLVDSHSEEFRFLSFPVLGPAEIEDTIRMLSELQYDHDNVKKLEIMTKTIGLWIERLLTNVGKLDEESRKICKQLFFRSSDKLEKFEVLVSKSAVLDSGTGTSKDTGGGKHRGSVMDAMGRMFKGNRAMKLNEENLERYNGNSGDTDYEPSDAGTIRNSNQPPPSPKEGGMGLAKRATMKLFSGRPSDVFDNKGRQSIVGGATAHSALEIAEKSSLLRIEVHRGQESHNGVVMYDIHLKIVGKKYKNPMMYQTSQRFSHFRKLYHQLVEINQSSLQADGDTHGPRHISDFMLLFNTIFPPLPMKSYLGLSLNDSELSERTRRLDGWFREVCVNYRNMPSNARHIIRQFLNFDMSQAKDIFFQDQLAWGVIEQQDSTTKPILVVQQSVLNSVSDTMRGELEETLSAVDGKRGPRPSLRTTKNQKQGKPSDVMSVRSRGEDSSQLHNLLWETASMGGTSKIHKKKAQQSRIILKISDE
jgi:hypothetical protein